MPKMTASEVDTFLGEPGHLLRLATTDAAPAERLQRTHVRVARPDSASGCDLLRVADRWLRWRSSSITSSRADEELLVRLFEELGRLHTALRSNWSRACPNSSTTTEPSATARLDRRTARRLGPERAGRASRCAPTDLRALQSSGRRSNCDALGSIGTADRATRENCRTAHGPPSTWTSRGSGSGCTTSRPACTTSLRSGQSVRWG